LLELALQAWAGQTHTVEMEPLVLLHCRRVDIFRTIVGSPKLKPYLKGQVAGQYLLVDPQHLEAFRSQLAWAGLSIDEHVTLLPLDSPVW